MNNVFKSPIIMVNYHFPLAILLFFFFFYSTYLNFIVLDLIKFRIVSPSWTDCYLSLVSFKFILSVYNIATPALFWLTFVWSIFFLISFCFQPLYIIRLYVYLLGFPETAKNLPAMWRPQVRSLHREDPLEKGMATYSSILAWKTPRTEERAGYSP